MTVKDVTQTVLRAECMRQLDPLTPEVRRAFDVVWPSGLPDDEVVVAQAALSRAVRRSVQVGQ